MLSNQLVRILALAVGLAGFVVILQSTTMGVDWADGLVRSHGGALDTTIYQAMLQGYAASLRLIGAILLGIGVFRALQPSK